MQLIDDQGRILQDRTFNNPVYRLSETIDLSDFPTGLYFIKILHDAGSTSQKLVKI